MPRVSTAQMYNHVQTQVKDSQAKYAKSVEKSATLKEINRSSDDPSGYVRAKGMHDQIAVSDQVAKNAEMARHFLVATEDVLTSVQEHVQQAQELAIQAADERGQNDVNASAMLVEVEGLYDGVLQAANQRFSDRTLLAGYQTDGRAFDKEGNFIGDEGQIKIEIEKGHYIPINVAGSQALQGKGMEQGTDIIDMFQRLMLGLSEGDREMVQGTLEDFSVATDQISIHRAQIGARMAQIDRAVDVQGTVRIDTLDAASKIEEADPTAVFTEMARDQTALNATMTTSQKILSELPKDLPFK